MLYLRQIMLGKGKYLKKTRYLILLIFFLISDNLIAKNIEFEILDYNNSLKNSSLLFIQTDGKTVEEGVIYIGSERIRVDYNKPNKITIVLTKKKGMYINHELEEVEYFDTKKSFVNVFLKIFMGNKFYKKSDIIISNGGITIKNDFENKEKLYKLEIIYENDPIKIRKIKVLENEEGFEMGFFNHNNLNTLDINFSLINPYLN